MLKVLGIGFATVMSLVLVGALPAQDEPKERPGPREKGGPGPDRGRHGPPGMGMGMGMMDPFRILMWLEPTEKQMTKAKALRKEYGPKLKAAADKFENSLTDDQKAARRKVFESARDSKPRKSPKEMMKESEEAMKLTDKQKEARKDLEKLQKEAREKVMALLTPEQKEKLDGLEKSGKGHGKGQGKGKGHRPPKVD